MCVAAVLLTAGFAVAADIRYMNSGPWQDVDTSDGVGWIGGVLPGSADNARANYGGWTGNTITLAYAAPTIKGLQTGVDESGALVINSGGVLTTVSSNSIGNNNWTIGKLIINAGGVMNHGTAGTFRVGYGSGGTKAAGWDPANPTATVGPTYGVLEINGGTLNLNGTGRHFWMANGGANAAIPGGPTCYGLVNINKGGVINVGGNIGLGTGDAATRAAGNGIATLNVNQGGLLNLYQWSDTASIQPGSVLNISGTGKVIVGGNRVTAANNYFTAGKIKSHGGNGTIAAVYDSVANKTTITAISKMNPTPANGSVIAVPVGPTYPLNLTWTNMDPNKPGDPVYVDVWFGKDPTWIPEPNQSLPGYPGHYVDFAKVVAGQNTAAALVNAPSTGGITMYYWRVDSYIYGAAHVGDPNFVITGDVFEFGSNDDTPPTVVINTPVMATWANRSVTMDATISDWGSSAVTYTWTSNPAGVVFSNPTGNGDPDTTATANPATFPETYVLTCSVKDAFNPTVTNTATKNMVVYANACAAARRNAPAEVPATDIDGDCVTELDDLVSLLSDWMTGYAIKAPTVIP